jgi:MSHA biogenesis protein MshL
VRTTSDADFWHEVQQTLVALIGSEDRRSVVLSPAAGVIVVRATPAELRQVGAYLEAMQLSIERQVMIEAKIIEVELNQDAQAGVNWAAFGNSLFGGNNRAVIGVGGAGVTLGVNGALSDANNTATPGSSVTVGASGKGFYGLAYQSPNFAALLNFLQTQGKAQVLSSPRIATLNNQKAVLKVGSDELYVTGISTTTTSSGTGSTSSPTVILQPFFSGIALDVTPQIDDDGHVILHVHPSVSTVTERTKNIDLGSLGAYRLPLAASTVNESDSIVRVGDGQIVAIGGLMQQSTHDDRNGVAGLSEVPVIGALFRQRSTTNGKHELVILMRPTVIRDGTAWPESDAGVPAVAPPEPAR